MAYTIRRYSVLDGSILLKYSKLDEDEEGIVSENLSTSYIYSSNPFRFKHTISLDTKWYSRILKKQLSPDESNQGYWIPV